MNYRFKNYSLKQTLDLSLKLPRLKTGEGISPYDFTSLPLICSMTPWNSRFKLKILFGPVWIIAIYLTKLTLKALSSLHWGSLICMRMKGYSGEIWQSTSSKRSCLTEATVRRYDIIALRTDRCPVIFNNSSFASRKSLPRFSISERMRALVSRSWNVRLRWMELKKKIPLLFCE